MIGGMRMASELVRPHVVSFLDMMLRDTNRNLRVEEVSVPPGSPLAGRTLREIDAHAKTNCLVMAARDPAGQFAYNPPDATVIAGGAVLIVLGDPSSVRALRALCEGAPALPTAGVPARV